jgi:hypothetical protein
MHSISMQPIPHPIQMSIASSPDSVITFNYSLQNSDMINITFIHPLLIYVMYKKENMQIFYEQL